MHLLLTFSDRLLGLHLLPLLLHQATLELEVVAIAAAVATEGQRQRHAPMPEQQHTRLPWQLPKLALHQCQLRHPLHLRQLQLPA